MKRIIVRKAGGYNRLAVYAAPDLRPSSNEVVVNVAYAGISYGDCIVRMGYYKSAKKLGFPITPGFEFSGRVAEVGSSIQSCTAGQEVFGVTLFNGYASQVCVPRNQLFAVPPGLSLVQAGTFPTDHITAWYAAVKQAAVQPGMTVLVHSAAGGVGSALSQVCKLLGCRVIGVVGSDSKVAIARAMGCDEVIDKSAEDLWSRAKKLSPAGYNVIFDANGVTTLQSSYRHLAPRGRLVVYGFHTMLPKTGGTPNLAALAWHYFKTPRFNPLDMVDSNKSVMAFNLSFLFGEKELLREAMAALLDWLSHSQLKLPSIKEYDFTQVAQAHRDIESGKTTGKLALRF